MKKNKIDINEKELDQLLNESFLEVDFTAGTVNRAMLDAVAKHAIYPSGQFTFLASNRLHQVFLAISFLIFLNSLYRYTAANTYPETEKINNFASRPQVEKEQESKRDLTKNNIGERNNDLNKKMSQLPAINADERKVKKNTRSKKTRNNHEMKISPAFIPPASLSDTLCDGRLQQINTVPVEHKLVQTQVDSINTLPDNKSTAANDVSAKRSAPPANFKVNSTKTMKAKKARKKRKKLFQKDGTFMLKGSKYKKSKI